MKKLLPLLAVLGATVAMLVMATTAAAGDTTCNGTLPAGSYDNVVVPSGANCTINGSTLKGNLLLQPGANVVDVRNTTINGNVQGESFRSLDLHVSRVNGSVQLKKWTVNVQICGTRTQNIQVEEGTAGRLLIGGTCASFGGNTTSGNIQVVKNRLTTSPAQIHNNTVGGDLQVFTNSGSVAIDIRGNSIRGNLQCKENRPAPTGGGNTAAKKEDQCRTF